MTSSPVIMTPSMASLIFNKKRKLTRRKRGSETQFPGKLHDMMEFVEKEGLEGTISWTSDGCGIIVHQPKCLLEILPRFFGQTKYRSFQRQLNMWRFERILDGPKKGAFVHPYFIKGKKSLCAFMSRHEFENRAQEPMTRNLVPTSKLALKERITGCEVDKSSDIFGSTSPYTLKQALSSLYEPVKSRSMFDASSLQSCTTTPQTDFDIQDESFVSFEGRSFYLVEDEIQQLIEKSNLQERDDNKFVLSQTTVPIKPAYNMLGSLTEPLSSTEIDRIFEDD